MVDFFAQLDYLRGVQRNFASGPNKTDIVGVFLNILMVVVPFVLVMAIWYYRHIFVFSVLHILSRLVSSKNSKIVENYLVTKGVLLEVFLYSSDGMGKKLCNARVSSVINGKMELDLLNVEPTSLKLQRQRVICYCKPFTYSGKKINAFMTFVGFVKKRGSVIKAMSLYTPIRYRFIIRRRHARQRIAREDAVRVKVWDGRKRKTFWMSKPDLQSITNPSLFGKKTRLVVENISAGGMRLLVMNPRGEMVPMKEGDRLVMRVSVWNPKTKKFTYFNVIGTIRSRFRKKGGILGLGIQFTASGEKRSGQYQWKSLQGELKPLADFLEKSKA